MAEIVDPTEIQIAKYVAKGYKPSQIAKIFNLVPSHITHIQSKEGFKELVASHTSETERRAQEIDDTYESIEMAATKAIKQKMEQGFYRPMDLLSIASMANKATRKRGNVANDGSEGTAGLFAKITLPAGLLGIEIIKTPENQVVRVGNTSLVPVSRESLERFANEEIEEIEAIQIPNPDDY